MGRRQGDLIERRWDHGSPTMGEAEPRSATASAGADSTKALAMVQAALDPGGTASLADLLGRVATAAGAVGCVLWEVVPPPPGAGRTRGETLFVLESWFQDPARNTERHGGVFARHD